MKMIVDTIEGTSSRAIRRGTIGSRRFWGRWCLAILIWGLLFEIGWPQASTDLETSATPSSAAQRTESALRGIVATTANLRAFPSMQSQVIAVAKDGAVIEIHAESGRWYRINTDDGREAWIGKSLVYISPSSHSTPTNVRQRRPPSEVPPLTDAHHSAPELLDSPPQSNTPSPISLIETAIEEDRISLVSSGIPFSAPEDPGFRSLVYRLSRHIEGIETYLIPMLMAILTLAIILQLRAVRQFRRAMLEMGEILGVVEEISANGRLQGADGVRALPGHWRNGAPAIQGQNPTAEFSTLERAVLQALSEEHEVQEAVLAKTLARQGFVSILPKAVVAKILGKTDSAGQALIDVQYHEGRYCYKLRSGGLSHVASHS